MFSCFPSSIEKAEAVALDTGSKGKKGAPAKRRSRPSGPKLVVLSVENQEVECQLETSKQKTVTFKFNIGDMVAADIANNLVS